MYPELSNYENTYPTMSTGSKKSYQDYRTKYYLPTVKKIYNQLPSGSKRIAKESYYFINPRRSWFRLKEKQRAYEHFVDRFFENEDEYETYKQEFFDTDITDIVKSHVGEVSAEHAFFDTHLNVCVNYYCLIRKRKPQTLIETGVYNGVSTTAILLALEENDSGTLYSIDYSKFLEPRSGDSQEEITTNPDIHYERSGPSCGDSTFVPADKQPGWIIPTEIQDRWELRSGDSRQELPALVSQVEEIDFFVHDSERSTSRMLFEFELVWGHLAQDGIMLSGHVAYNDALETFAEERQCNHGIYDVLWDPEPNPIRSYSSRNPSRCGYITKR